MEVRVHRIIEQCARSGQQFVDEEFQVCVCPLDQLAAACFNGEWPLFTAEFWDSFGSKRTPPQGPLALHRDPGRAKHQRWLQLQWRRPESFAAEPEVFVPPVAAQSIKQGVIGDCWFMSALSVLTQRQDRLQKLFITTEHNDAGVYAVRFHKDGVVRDVLIDSQFPADDKGRPAFGRSTRENELWVMILEKAYAKMHQSYEAIESGFVDQALVDMTGGVGSRVDMTSDDVRQNIRNGTLWKQLQEYNSFGYLMGAGSPAGSDREANASASGIVQGHAYAILDIRQVGKIRLLRLRNPWGRKEWTGDWSDKSPLWTKRMKVKLDFVDAEDGTFWMSFEDFTAQFDDIYVCRFFDAVHGWVAHAPVLGEWKGLSAGGCTNFSSVVNSPQYIVDVSVPMSIVLMLAQADTRGTDQELKAISVELYDNEGQRVRKRHCGQLVSSNPESYIFRREVSLEVSLQPGRYTALFSAFNRGDETSYTIRMYSQGAALFQEAPEWVA